MPRATQLVGRNEDFIRSRQEAILLDNGTGTQDDVVSFLRKDRRRKVEFLHVGSRNAQQPC